MLLATVSVPANAVALKETLEQFPEIEVQVEQIAAHSTKWTMPCLWISAADFEAVDAALATDPSVQSVTKSCEFSGEKYYHLEWSDTVKERINTYLDKKGSILHAQATAGKWELKFRFVSREQFDVFRETLADNDYAFELLDLTEPGSPRTSASGLTASQRDALVVAYKHGYYAIPRKTTLRELAAELEISHQALSELLRRGTEQLIETSLTASVETSE